MKIVLEFTFGGKKSRYRAHVPDHVASGLAYISIKEGRTMDDVILLALAEVATRRYTDTLSIKGEAAKRKHL